MSTKETEYYLTAQKRTWTEVKTVPAIFGALATTENGRIMAGKANQYRKVHFFKSANEMTTNLFRSDGSASALPV